MGQERSLQAQKELAMFGCPMSALDTMAMSAKERGGSIKTLATSILSDAQEEIELGHANRARQMINRAKYLIHEHLNE